MYYGQVPLAGGTGMASNLIAPLGFSTLYLGAVIQGFAELFMSWDLIHLLLKAGGAWAHETRPSYSLHAGLELKDSVCMCVCLSVKKKREKEGFGCAFSDLSVGVWIQKATSVPMPQVGGC